MSLHVAIDARIPAGFAGGVAQVVMGLAQGFTDAAVPDLERTWLVYPDAADWLLPHLPEGDEVVVTQTTVERVGKALASKAPALVSKARPHVERALGVVARVRKSNGGPFDDLLRSRGVDVVHLPFQDGLPTELPSVYHPHDLQHHYLPQYFTKAQLHHRETVWRQRAHEATLVSVGTGSARDDVVRFWQVDPEKVRVVPLAPLSAVTSQDPEPATSTTHEVLYPAAFWPHKNHATLVRAVGVLRREGLDVELRLPGAHVGIYNEVLRVVEDEGMDPQQVLPGFVTDATLSGMFNGAAVVAVPSKFESASFPVWEAFLRGKPVVVARTTALPQQVGQGGLVVDADDVQGFAAALRTLLVDADLRARTGEVGRRWATQFTWRRTVLATSALYRIAAGREPGPEEHQALVDGPFI